MQASDLKIGALYVVKGVPDGTYRGFGPALDGGPFLHNFTLDDGKTALGLSDWQLAGNVEPAPVTDLRALAAGVAAYNHSRRVAALRDVHRWAEHHTLELAKTPIDVWVARKLAEDVPFDFLLDNFPQGATFKLCGVECMSAGLDGASAVKYVTATPQGLQERRLPFAMAAAVVLGAPI